MPRKRRKKAGNNSRFQRLFANMIDALCVIVQMEDPRAHHRYDRVARYTVSILDELAKMKKIEKKEQLKKSLYIAALIHDLGKIRIHPGILNKPGPLTEREWREIKKHPVWGEKVISLIDELKEVAQVVRYHHERIDGKGYPAGLKGKRIPLSCRIMAVADAFDAMVSKRPFRKRRTERQAIAELHRNAHTQFDVDCVEAFIRAYRKGKIKKIGGSAREVLKLY